jgi:hypothetical protein
MTKVTSLTEKLRSQALSKREMAKGLGEISRHCFVLFSLTFINFSGSIERFTTTDQNNDEENACDSQRIINVSSNGTPFTARKGVITPHHA